MYVDKQNKTKKKKTQTFVGPLLNGNGEYKQSVLIRSLLDGGLSNSISNNQFQGTACLGKTIIKAACNSWLVGYTDLPSEVTATHSVLLTAAIVT